jgi:endoplasmic reticulum-Golgi intermediate compartment protein 2
VFNFSHMITELSFGPHFPTLLNPLDKTMSSTEVHYFKYQYFLNLVPTIYTKGNGALSTYTQAATSQALSSSPMSSTSMMVPPEVLLTKKKNMIFTNQYSATSQSRSLPESPYYVPGIFFKYNIEPILLLVSEERGSFLALMVRLVNVVSGVIVSGGWLFQLSSWFSEVVNRRRARRQSEGVLNGRLHEKHDD